MELNLEQQIFDQIKRAQKILIALPKDVTTDSLAAGLGLKLFLTKLQKDVVAAGGPVPEQLKFLPGIETLTRELDGGKSLVITLNTKEKKLAEISYQTEADKVSIYLKSQGQEFTQEDLTFATEKFPLDLIVCLGVKSLEDLGALFEKNPDLFFETPKINIDNSAANEYYGAINLVDAAATSLSEILADLLQKFEAALVDENIATCLLTGIIEKTGSFQRSHTTPRAFIKASELVALGGRQQEIIKHIYKTKPMSLLKLWGRALARMKILEEKNVVYTTLNRTDFEKAESTSEELLPALLELLNNLGGYQMVAILAEPGSGQSSLVMAVTNGQLWERFSALDGQPRQVQQDWNNFKIIGKDFAETSLEDLEKLFLDNLN